MESCTLVAKNRSSTEAHKAKGLRMGNGTSLLYYPCIPSGLPGRIWLGIRCKDLLLISHFVTAAVLLSAAFDSFAS